MSPPPLSKPWRRPCHQVPCVSSLSVRQLYCISLVQGRIQDFSKEGRGAVGVEGSGVWWGLGLSPEINPNLSAFCHSFQQIVNADSHQKPWDTILRFNCKTKLTETVQKLSQNSRSDQKGRSHHRPPEYAAGFIHIGDISSLYSHLQKLSDCVANTSYWCSSQTFPGQLRQHQQMAQIQFLALISD